MGRPNKRETKGYYILEKRRKQAYKTLVKLLKKDDVKDDYSNLFSETPTTTICIANLGFGGVGGISPEAVNSALRKFNGFKNVEMPIGMPFSFVQFNTVEDAINALELIHYKPCADLEDRVLYAGFYPDQIVINEIIDFNYHVPGLVYHDEFITLEEENEMLSAIESYEGWGIVKGRHVKHFGYEFSYKIKHVGLKMDPFPNFVVPALHRFYKAYPQYHTMDQLTISSYPVGSGIPPHCDSHTAFHNTILIISLKNQIVMEFRKPSTGEVGHRLLKPRSLVIIGGESRYGWEHSIKLRKSDPLPDGQLMERKERLSLTFRKIQNEPGCGCLFKDLCDIDYYKKIRESQITFNK